MRATAEDKEAGKQDFFLQLERRFCKIENLRKLKRKRSRNSQPCHDVHGGLEPRESGQGERGRNVLPEEG